MRSNREVCCDTNSDIDVPVSCMTCRPKTGEDRPLASFCDRNLKQNDAKEPVESRGLRPD